QRDAVGIRLLSLRGFWTYSSGMRKTPVQGSENTRSSAERLVAADDARRRSTVLARAALVVGIVLIAGSTMLWPQGLFGVGSHTVGLSVFLIVSGALLLLSGIFVSARALRRLSRLQNNYSSVGKPDAGFVREPHVGLPQIGQGHGGPLDASAALFANPDKVFKARS
ncbi:hypothetical protein, partial [Cryobacterium sp. MLB-32]